MRLTNSRQVKRYIARLIKEEKEAMENPFADFDDMEDMQDMEPMSNVSDGTRGGYQAGYDAEFEEDMPMEVEGPVEEAVIPLKLLRGARRLSESREVSTSSRKVAAAYNRFKRGQINESEFYRSLRKITGIPTYRTFVSNGNRRVSIRKFVRG
jgi:hypothetical protein